MSDIVLIDLSSILHQVWHVSTDDPNPNATSIKTVERVRALASGQPHVGICVDTPPYFRAEIDPLYKANRPKEDRAPLWHQMSLALDTLRGDGFPIFGAKGYEADDIIATLVAGVLKQTSPDNDPAPLTICTSDKDLEQLVNDLFAVRIKSVRDGAVTDEAAVVAKRGVGPNQIVDYLSMCGDKSDNVPGIPGVGAVTAAAFLKKYGSLDALYAKIDEGATFDLTPTQRTRLVDFRAQYPKTKALITLRTDAPIDVADLFKPRVHADVATFGESGDTFGEAPSIGGSAGGSMAAVAGADATGEITPAGSVGDSRQHFQQMPNGDVVRTATGEVVPQSFVEDINEAFSDTPALKADKPSFHEAITGTKEQTHGTGRREETAQATDTKGATGAATHPYGHGVVVGDALHGDAGTRPGHGPQDLHAHRPRVDGSDRTDSGRVESRNAEAVALARVEPGVEYDRQLEPRSMSEAVTLAKWMYESRLFSAYGSPQAVLSTVLAGREFGIPAMASLRSFHIIDGKPTLSAGLIQSLVLKSGKCDYFRCVERTPKSVTFETQRKGEPPFRMSYTIEEARQAWTKNDAAWANSTWGRSPADMLVARCSSKLARLVYPDVLAGAYSVEEFD